MEVTQIPVKDLHVSPLNVRKQFTPKDTTDLVSSIKAVGLLSPLVVRKNESGYEVLAGQRRLAALKELESDTAPCYITEANDGQAITASLAENYCRQALHPVEECEAFLAVRETGDLSPAHIAAWFGVSPKYVSQRLLLAELEDDVRKYAKHANVSMALLEPLTMTGRTIQREWKRAHKEGEFWASTPEGIRGRIVKDRPSSRDAVFDQSLYTGKTTTDLFGDMLYFDDVEEFTKLQMQAVEAVAQELRDKGWSWVTTAINPLNRPSEYEYGKSKNKKMAGCLVFVEREYATEQFGGRNYTTKIRTIEGLLDPATVKRLEKEKLKAASDEQSNTGNDEDTIKLSNAAKNVTRDVYRAAIARTILEERDSKRLVSIIADLLGEGRVSGSQWQFDPATKTAAPDAYVIEGLYRGTMTEFGVKLTPSEKVAKVAEWLAMVVGVTIPDGVKVQRIRDFWTPSAEYLMKLPKPMLQEAAKACAIKEPPEKKGDLVRELVAAFEEGKGKNWLPMGIDEALRQRTVSDEKDGD